jgi:ATP-dependent RNA helicase DHX29
MNLRDSSNEDSDSSIDPDDLIPEFISLQSQLYSLQPNYFDRSNKVDRPLNDSDDTVSLITKIQRKLSRLEKDVLFDREEAERKWREKLTELRKEAAFTRQEDRRGKSASVAYNDKDKPTDQLVIEKDLSAAADDNLDFVGDMFLIDSSDLEPPSTIVTQQPSIVIRDFGQTDSISTTPRQLLEETCKAK